MRESDESLPKLEDTAFVWQCPRHQTAVARMVPCGFCLLELWETQHKAQTDANRIRDIT